jgi:hypothetical protein
MTHTTPPELQPSVASLLSGIVIDVQTLFFQELTTARLEVENQLYGARRAAVRLGIGLGFSVIVGIQLACMLVYGLAAYTELPLWGCYGLSGGVFAIVGALAYSRAKNLLDGADLFPTRPTQAKQENG